MVMCAKKKTKVAGRALPRTVKGLRIHSICKLTN